MLSEPSAPTLSHTYDSSIQGLSDDDNTVGGNDDHNQESTNANSKDFDTDDDAHHSFNLLFPATSQVGRDHDPHSSPPDVQEVREGASVSLKDLRSKSCRDQRAMIRALDGDAARTLLLDLLKDDSKQRNQIENLRKAKKHATQRIRRQRQRIERDKATIHELKNPKLQDLDVRRKNSRRLSWAWNDLLGFTQKYCSYFSQYVSERCIA